MHVAGIRSALLAAAIALALPAPGQAPPAPAPRPYEDVIRLHAAGLSDDFIVRKIGRDGVAYALTTDDIIACKKAGVPESVIEAMLKTSPKPAAAPAPAPAVPAPPAAKTPEPPKAVAAAPVAVVPAAAPAAVAPVAPAPAPAASASAASASPATAAVPRVSGTPGPESAPAAAPALAASAATAPAPAAARAPEPGPGPAPAPVPEVAATPAPAAAPAAGPASVSFADRSFGGLVRRAPGVVLFKYPWEPGTLAFRGATLTWTDASDPAKNVVLEAADLTEQFLVCPKETDYEGACWEWGVKTASAEYRFRDEAWEKMPSARPSEIYALVKGAMPRLPESRYRSSRKK